MNFISSDAAYSLYPIATFENRSALCMPNAHSSPEAIKKYVKRGWRIYFVLTPNDLADPMKPPFLLDQVRWVSDRHTWTLSLDQTGVKARPPLSRSSAPLMMDPVLLNGWKLKLLRGASINGYECHYYPLSTTVFRYNYAIPDEALCLDMRYWATLQGQHSHRHLSKEDWVWCVPSLATTVPGF
jgi:hypothetical protein